MRQTASPIAFLTALLAASSFAAPPVSADNPRGFTAKDLVMLDRVSAPQFSPDGDRILYALRETNWEADRGVGSLWVTDASGGHGTRLTPADLPANAGAWSPDVAFVYFLSAKSGSMQVWRVPAGGGDAAQVTAYPLDIGSFRLAPDGKAIAVSFEVFADCATLACTADRVKAEGTDKRTGVQYDRIFVRHWDTWKDGTRSQVFLGALGDDGKATGEPRLLTKGLDGDVPGKPFGDQSDDVFSPDGKRLVFSVRVAGKTEPWSTNFDLFEVPVDGSAAPKTLTDANDATDTNPVFSADGKTLFWRAMKRPGFEADRFGLMAMDRATGEVREIAADWDRSFDTLVLGDDGRTMYTATLDTGTHPVFEVNLSSGAVRKVVQGGNIGAFDVDGDRIVFTRDTIAQPADLYLGAIRARIAERRLTNYNAERLSGIRMGEYEPFSFKGWNDATVHGYVIKPWNAEPGKKAPVAFLIHGGPQGSFHNQWHYRWNAQTYAGMGFAVVMIDFHGSTGYGQAFTDSISEDWGGKPLVDLQKGWAAALAKYDFLDGERACALGGSYGGYMVNWIAGNWNEPWDCFVNHAGVFDLRSMAYSTEELWFTEWENGGVPWENAAAIEKHNPVNFVQNWRVPMLVIHGQKDYRVLVEQGLATFTALQRRGIESELLYFPDENHWILRPHNSVQWHESVNRWLQRHAGGR
ncbi:MAG: prolyl oligopeptidase family serine peptidase [Lysobacteraceae bacterium]